jgi:hypothetical protein
MDGVEEPGKAIENPNVDYLLFIGIDLGDAAVWFALNSLFQQRPAAGLSSISRSVRVRDLFKL